MLLRLCEYFLWKFRRDYLFEFSLRDPGAGKIINSREIKIFRPGDRSSNNFDGKRVDERRETNAIRPYRWTLGKIASVGRVTVFSFYRTRSYFTLSSGL